MTSLANLFPEGSEGRAAARQMEGRPDVPSLLASDVYDPVLTGTLVGLDGAGLLSPARVKDAAMAEAARAGLLLWNDSFEESHSIAQGIESAAGSYWHAICHRREGHRGAGLESNLGNARHWFRRVGEHPIFGELYQEASRIAAGSPAKQAELERRGRWDPFLFIEWCQACEHGEDREGREALKAIQAAEIRLLLAHCLHAAL